MIEGGHPLTGETTPAGNKNSILPIICASILSQEPVFIKNVPRIIDVEIMLQIFEELGGRYEYNKEGGELMLDARKVEKYTVSAELGTKLRASNLFLAPLWVRFGKAVVPHPGGDYIGPREMTAHYETFRTFGAKIEENGKTIKIEGRRKAGYLHMYEPSVTATENAIMASVLNSGETTIYGAACEPHVQELCEFLNSMGARIDGIGTNKILIEGVDRLRGTIHEIWSDFTDVGVVIILAAITGGEIRIKNVRHEDLNTILFFFEAFNIKTIRDGKDLIIPAKQELKTVDPLWSSIKGVYSQPWPGFPTDLMSQTVVLATQTVGTTLFFEKMFPGRLYFASFLNGMGANIILCDPHRIVVNGRTPLRAAHLVAPDIRAGVAYLVAAFVADGTSIVESVYHIDRGHPMIEKRLAALGAKIQRVNSES